MVKISEISNQNPWWIHGADFFRYDKHLTEVSHVPIFFERKALNLKKENIYVLRGSRQAGKTTYLKKRIRDIVERVEARRILYLSLDFFVSRRELRNALNYFLDINRDASELYIFLDEITSLPDWNFELKYLADSGVTRKAPILATGSSAFSLKAKAELLPGRGLEGNEYYFKPLSFREFVIQSIEYVQARASPEFSSSLRNLKKVLEKTFIESFDLNQIKEKANSLAPFKKDLEYFFKIYMLCGGFPKVINHYLAGKFGGRERLDSLLAEILIRDVLGDLARQGKSEVLARQILQEIIEKYGSRYSFSTLARGVESTHVTIIDYLEFLEQAFIASVVYAYDFDKKEIKFKADKKVYFADPFIYHSLRSYLTGRELSSVSAEALESEETLGKLIEGVIYSHLARTKEQPYLRDPNTFLWYYYDSRGREIDFILRDKDYLGIEVKYRSAGKEFRKIDEIKNYLLLTKEELYEGAGALAIPAEIFLALLNTSAYNL